MSRFISLSIVVVLSLAATAAMAAPRHKKQTLRPHSYGFLPGYQQPLNNAAPLFKQEAAVLRNAFISTASSTAGWIPTSTV